MSAICSEFVQNAWRKDLCSNCFKARSDHALTNGTLPDGLPPLVAPKMVPYVPFKRTILEINTSNNNNNNKLISNNNSNNHHNIEVRLPKSKFSNGTSSEQPSHQRKIGSSGVHLWEVGQMPQMAKNGSLDREVEVKIDVANGEKEEKVEAGKVCGTSKPGILKEKPLGPLAVKKAAKKPERRSSVVFIDEQQVIGYGGNDYDWDDDESSEELSDVDSLDNYDLTEEDKVIGELTDRNTEYNADNTNLLLNESHKQTSSIFVRQVGGSGAPVAQSVADKLTPQCFYSMPAKPGHKMAAQEQTASGGWISDGLAADWEEWTTAEMPERDLGNWSAAESPEKDSGKALLNKSEDDALMHGSSQTSQDWSSTTPLMKDFKNTMPAERDSVKAAPDLNGAAPLVVSTGKEANGPAPRLFSMSKEAPDTNGVATRLLSSSKAPTDANGAVSLTLSTGVSPDSNGAVSLTLSSSGNPEPEVSSSSLQMYSSGKAASELNGTVPKTCSVQNVRDSSSSEDSSSSRTDQPSSDARCFIDSLFSAESEPVRLSFLTSEDSEEDSGTSAVRPDVTPDSTLAASAHRAGIVTVPTRKHPVTHRATAQQLFNEEPVTAAELQAVSQKLPPTGDPRAWLQSDESSSLMSSKPLVSRNRQCSPYGIVPISSVRTKSDYATSKPQDPHQAPVIPSAPPPSSNDESQRYPYLRGSSLPTGGSATMASDSANAKDSSLPRSSLGPCSTFHSPVPRDAESRFRNREYAAVNYSCHYASSYVTNGGSATQAFPATTLPPTPLTNPYSSTAILKGIPQVPDSSPPQKPKPVTKPKPKLPVKPVAIQRRSSEDGPKRAEESLESSKVHNNSPHESSESAAAERVSACYQEIDGEDIGKTASFESKVAALSGNLDLSKKIPKRKAPRPPTGTSNYRTPDIADGSQYKKPIADNGLSSRRSSDQNFLDAGQPGCHMPRAVPVADQQQLVNRSLDHSPIVDQYSTSETMPNEVCSANGSSSSYSFSKTSSSMGYGFHQQKETPVFRENGKPKKSKFSLKKLLKFGSSKEEPEEHRSKGKGLHHHSNGRAKLEILHPIDLINNAANDTNKEHSSGAETGSSSKTSSIGSHHGAVMSADAGNIAEMPQSERHEPSPVVSVDPPSDYNQPRYKPPPPPRSRSHTEEGSKDKPSRPPPPIKRGQALTRTPAVDNCIGDEPHQEETSTPVLRRNDLVNCTALDNEDNRNSVYSVGMEYANLGRPGERDVRNNMAPKKPGRCSSNSMIDVSMGCDTTNGEDSNAPESHDNAHAFRKTEVTYYAPTEESQQSNHRDEEAVDMDDLYGDQTPLPSEFSSINLDSLSSNFSNAKADVSESATTKIYEHGNSEKVSTKPPAVAPPTPLEHGNNATPSASLDHDDEELSGAVAWPRRKSSRLSLRKTKTVVHKNLEDNYGAVVSANHQTLTQILEQVTLTQQANASKVKMLGEVSVHWSDFRLTEDSPVTIVGDKAFYSATWQQNVELTLMVSQDPLCTASHATRNSCVLLPIVEFEDVIPASMFPSMSSSEEEGYRRGTVWVLDRTRVDTLSSLAESLQQQRAADIEAYERETCFVLLQLINGLKHLQVQGIEEVDPRATDFALTAKRNEANHRLVILPPSEKSQKKHGEKLSLCQSALSAMFLLLIPDMSDMDYWTAEVPSSLPSAEAFALIANVLRQERATSLSRAKLLLEYLLWGPTDLQGLQGPQDSRGQDKEDVGYTEMTTPEEEQAYQRWLDLERATVLNNLIRTQSLWQIRLTVFEEYMLSFLVRTCAKTLRDAAKQLRVNQFGNS